MSLMRFTVPALAGQALLLAALTAAVPASAQTSGSGTSSLWAPGSGRNSIGLNLGQSNYNTSCGSALFACDDTDRAIHLYARSMTTQNFGAELGLLDLGSIDRAGGSTRARGLNLSLVGRVPLGSAFGVYGKLGTTYGQTRTSAALGSGVSEGTENGFGLAYGAGVSYDFTPQLSAVVEWDSHDFRFAGGGRDPVRSTSLGLQFRY